MFKNYIDNLVNKVREESYIYTGYSYPIDLMDVVEFNFKKNYSVTTAKKKYLNSHMVKNGIPIKLYLGR